MEKFTSAMAERLARAAISFQQERTGHAPKSATVVFGGDMLVITLHGALSEGERVLSKSPEGAARVQAFHRELFSSSAATFGKEIERISGLTVREAAGEIEPCMGAVVHAFTSGTMVQVFQMAQTCPLATLDGNAPGVRN